MSEGSFPNTFNVPFYKQISTQISFLNDYYKCVFFSKNFPFFNTIVIAPVPYFLRMIWYCSVPYVNPKSIFHSVQFLALSFADNTPAN